VAISPMDKRGRRGPTTKRVLRGGVKHSGRYVRGDAACR
jgi:hypothetical protein